MAKIQIYCCPVNFKTAEKSGPKPFRIGLRAFFFEKQAPWSNNDGSGGGDLALSAQITDSALFFLPCKTFTGQQ